MKTKLTKTIATVMALAIILSCMMFAAPSAFAADGNTDESSLNTEEFIAFAKEHPVLAKIGLKLMLWAAENAVEGAAEGVGDHYEDIGENAGDRFDDWADNIEDGSIAEAEDPKVIVGDLYDGATDAEDIGQDAADGATDSFPLCVVGEFKPEITESLNESLAETFTSAFQKVFDKLPDIG